MKQQLLAVQVVSILYIYYNTLVMEPPFVPFRHNKKYDSAEEAMSKFAVFKQNLAFIRQHNADYEQGKHTYTVGMNHMGDMTNDEYKSMLHVCKGKMTKEKLEGVLDTEIKRLGAETRATFESLSQAEIHVVAGREMNVKTFSEQKSNELFKSKFVVEFCVNYNLYKIL